MLRPGPFNHFRTNPEIVRPAVMLHIRFPLSLRNLEDTLRQHGIESSHDTVRF
jgi:putative transposase